ncbi:Cell cycle serine/threonine-protein kinase cdc5/MSD2, partial [Mortierella sp. NVP41]
GGFASCFMISDQKNGRYAAKVIQKTELHTAKTKQKLFAEIKIHAELTENKNIVKYYHCFEDDNFVYLVLELCESKTLMELIKRRKRLTEPEVRYYMQEIVSGCAYLHEKKIIHRDLKLGNIFLTKDLHVRIGDFGLAAVILNEGDRKKTICGTPNYIAPEILFDTDNGHSFEVDVWSVGVIMYTLLIGKPPFQTNEVKAIYKKIRDNSYEFPKDVPISEEARSLIAALLDPKPTSRPSIAEVTGHAFFTSGYCPKKLDRRTLESAPNFDREERLLKQQQIHQEMLQLRDEELAAHAQLSKRYSDFTADMLDQMPTTPTTSRQSSAPIQPHASGSGQHHDPARYTHIDASASSRQAQQTGNPASANRFRYGDQIKMEMVDGDKVTTEIRTINGPRTRTVPDFQQYSQAHARLQKEQQQQQQQQQSSHMSSTATGNDFSTFAPQANRTERGPLSRLPVPRSRVNLPPNTTSFQQTHTIELEQQQQPSSVTATPARSSFKSPFHNVASPRPQSSMAIGASSPNLSNLPRSSIPVQHQRQDSQLGTSHSPSPMNRRRSSDMVSIPGGSAFGKALMDRRQESKRLGIAAEEPADTPQSGMDDLFSPVAMTPSRFSYHEDEHQRTPNQRDMASSHHGGGQHRLRHDDLMELDSEGGMEVDQDVNQHLDLLVTKISEIPQAFIRPSNSQPKRIPGSSQSHQEQLSLQSSQARYGDTNGRAHHGESTAPSTLIQNVHGIERPASAMQRTFSQEREMSEMGRGLESPRKVSRTFHYQVQNHHTSGEASSPLPRGMSPFNPVASLSQSQQHSFLHSSPSGHTLKHHSSQPLSLHQRHASATASSASLRQSSQSSQQWPVDVMGVGLDRGYRGESTSPGASPKLTHYVPPMSLPLSPTQRPQSLPMERTRSHPSQRRVGLGLSVSEQNDVHGSTVGGLVRSAPEDEFTGVQKSDMDASRGSQRQQQQPAELAGPTRPPSSLRLTTPSQGASGKQGGIEDPYRYQFTSPLQRRNQQAKQQQMLQQSLLSQSPTPPIAAPVAKPMTKITAKSSLPSFPSPTSNSQQHQPHSPRQDHNSHHQDQSSSSNSQSLSPSLSRSHHSSQHQQEDSGSRRNQQPLIQNRARQIVITGSSGMDTSTSDSESSMTTSSMDQSRTYEEFETRRKQQLIKKRQLKRSAAATAKLDSVFSLGTGKANQDVDEAEQDELFSAPAGAGGNQHQNGRTKQSNETTMAGMSSGGNSDEQDHVEVPSTSCITTTSLSLSMHHDHPAHQKQQQQQQQQHTLYEDATVQSNEIRVERVHRPAAYRNNFNNKDLQQPKQRQRSGRMESEQPPEVHRKLGSQEEVELTLRTLIADRREGRLGYPFEDAFTSEAPEVFVIRWVNYQHRYGFGFQLTNSVFGVICNDNYTVVLSPNGEDIEIINGTANPNARSASLPPTKSSRRKDKDKDGSVSRAPSVTPSSKDQQEATTDKYGGSSRPTKEGEGSHAGTDSVAVRNSARSRELLKDVDMYDRLDDEDYLKTLERSYCRMSDYPARFEKKLMLLNSFKDFMLNCLKGLPPWTYEEEDLTRDMPFLTDIFQFQKTHVVSRLSNGITQVNFADHTKLVFSDRGRVVSFMDNDEKRRRVTITTRQALTPEFFYDLEDPQDQAKKIQDELKEITQARTLQDSQKQHLFSRGDRRNDGREEPFERRPVFNPDKDIDLVLFPRPNLARQIARATVGMLPATEDLLSSGEDATLIEETPITNDDKRVVIRRMTFKALHIHIVLRLRIAQRLMRERALELAEERMEARIKKEAATTEREREGAHGGRRRHHRKHHHHHRSKESRESRDAKDGGVVVVKTENDMSGVLPQPGGQLQEAEQERANAEPMSEAPEEEDGQWDNIRVKIEDEEA